jgi:cytochrome oxidase Cu insertion factor (SCO1/SenC/PrrC family)
MSRRIARLAFRARMMTMRIPAAALIAFLAAGTVLLAQSSGPTRAEIDALGPQVGERAPDFTLSDQNGQPRQLSSLLGPKGALLVFFRSADW